MTSTCAYCDAALAASVPQNVGLLDHLKAEPECRERFAYLVDNLNASWTLSMSGP